MSRTTSRIKSVGKRGGSVFMPENEFGYLSLSIPTDDGFTSILIRANRIFCILPADDDEGMHISFGGKEGVVVVETIDEILEQLDNIPSSLL